MESPGAKLKRIRLEKGLSLEDVHKKTKIHLNILKAIEEDSLVNFSPVYIKGFLKIYCKFLGVDSEETKPIQKITVTPLKSETTKHSEAVPVLKTMPLKVRPFTPYFRIKKIKAIVIAVSIVIFAFLLFKLGKIVSSRVNLGIKRKAPAEVVLVKVPVKKSKVIKAQESPAPVKSVAKEKSAKPPPREGVVSVVSLGVHAKEDCWLQVKIDGKVVFHSILKKGKTESWQAKEKIEFSANNSAALDIVVNTKPYPSIGRRGQAIRNALITKEGLINIPR